MRYGINEISDSVLIVILLLLGVGLIALKMFMQLRYIKKEKMQEYEYQTRMLDKE